MILPFSQKYNEFEKGGNSTKKRDIELIAFSIIANAGDAMSSFFNALNFYKKGDKQKSEELMKAGDEFLIEAHKAQFGLISKESNNEDIPYSLIMVHAQNHLMGALNTKNNVKEMMDLYDYIEEKTNNI